MERKRGGFKSFVRRRDGKSPVPEVKVDLESLSQVTGVRLRPLDLVLLGEYRGLIHAFAWSSTPQGLAYWNNRCVGEVPLSPEDYQWLQELYDYHAQQQQD